MAITDYASLKESIADRVGRSDLTSASSVIDEFIRDTTDYLNNGADPMSDPPLRCREMEAVTDLTPSSGVCTLPSDYLEYRRVVEKVSPRRELTYITPDQAESLYPSRTAGLACSFTIIGSSLYTFPLASNDIELTHYQQIDNLDGGTTTNWLLTKAPQVYLRGCLMFAADYFRDDSEFAKQSALLRTLVSGLNGSNMLANYARASRMSRGSTP